MYAVWIAAWNCQDCEACKLRRFYLPCTQLINFFSLLYWSNDVLRVAWGI